MVIAAPPTVAETLNVFVVGAITKYTTSGNRPVGKAPVVVNITLYPAVNPWPAKVTTPGVAMLIVAVEADVDATVPGSDIR